MPEMHDRYAGAAPAGAAVQPMARWRRPCYNPPLGC